MFESEISDPVTTVAAILPRSMWSSLLLRSLMQNAIGQDLPFVRSFHFPQSLLRGSAMELPDRTKDL